jgi:hypothetical protein
MSILKKISHQGEKLSDRKGGEKKIMCMPQEAASMNKLLKLVVFCNGFFFQHSSGRHYSHYSSFLADPCKLSSFLSLSFSLMPSSHNTYVLFAEDEVGSGAKCSHSFKPWFPA